MDWFLVKKTFFDSWDNLPSMVLLNCVYIVLVVLFVFLVGPLEQVGQMFQMGTFAVFLFVFCFYSIGVASATFNYSNYKSGIFTAFKDGIIYKWSHVFLLWAMNIVSFIIPFIGIPYYIKSGNIALYCICSVLIFFELYLVLSLQYYCPLAFAFDKDKPMETLLKAFRITSENFWFSFLLLFICAFKLFVSILTILLVPGFAGISLSRNNAAKLILMRSRWMNEHNISCKSKVDYNSLLEEERLCVGKRSLKGMLFPWKDK